MPHNRKKSRENPSKPARCDPKPIAAAAELNPKDGTPETHIPESDLSGLVSALMQDKERLQRSNEWFKSEAERWSGVVAAFQKTKELPLWKDPFLLTVLTGCTLGILVWYTIETKKLRVAAEAQLETQTLPIVVLTSQDDPITQKTTIVVRNVGLGPALNAATARFTIGHAEILTKPSAKKVGECKDVKDEIAWLPASKPATIQLNHRTAIAVRETHDIDGEEQINGEEVQHEVFQDMCNTPPYKRVTPVSNVVKLIADEKLPKAICIAYESAQGRRYESWQTFDLPSPNNLAIDFICHRGLKDKLACRSARIQEVQDRLDRLNGRPLGNACPSKD
jgi:hypothetical protein